MKWNLKGPNAVAEHAVDFEALVERILTLRESETLELKRLGGKNEKKIETILAFANAKGGSLILGVEDADKARGRDRLYGIEENTEALDELKRLVRHRFTPPMAPAAMPMPQFIPVPTTLRDGAPGHLMIVHVEPSSEVHSLVNGGTYVRYGSSNREVSAAEITNLSLQRGAVSFVALTVDVALELLDTEYFHGYATARKLTRPFRESLLHLGLAKQDAAGALKPTRAAVLLFAEDPAGVLDAKCTVRIFHYRGDAIEHKESTNLLRPPKTIRGPIIVQIRDAISAVMDALASGIQMGPLGFELTQKYPVRVITETITNAVIHRDYFTQGDIHIRIFDHRIEVESPGVFPGAITQHNISKRGSFPRNKAIVDGLREFPNPPNLDAGEGVRMIFATMDDAHLYPPVYVSTAELGRDAVRVTLFNESRPSVWDQVTAHLDRHITIGNAEVRKLLKRDDTLAASKLIRTWVDAGLLLVSDPNAAKRYRRYERPGTHEKLPAHYLDAKIMNRSEGQ
jgi:ATP-dependent DNA helicase RecG